VTWWHRQCEIRWQGQDQQIRTLQGIISNQQETINRLQNAVDAANERYNEMVKESLSQRWPTVLDQSLFEERPTDDAKMEWLTPKPEEITE